MKERFAGIPIETQDLVQNSINFNSNGLLLLKDREDEVGSKDRDLKFEIMIKFDFDVRVFTQSYVDALTVIVEFGRFKFLVDCLVALISIFIAYEFYYQICLIL